MSTAHPGFAAVAAKIARKEGVSANRAGAILAASTRRAGRAARRRNPRLNRVKGGRRYCGGGMVKGYADGGMVNCPSCHSHTKAGEPCMHCGGYVPRGYSKGGRVTAKRSGRKSVMTQGGNVRNDLKGESTEKRDIDQGRTFRRDYPARDSQMSKYKVTEWNSD